MMVLRSVARAALAASVLAGAGLWTHPTGPVAWAQEAEAPRLELPEDLTQLSVDERLDLAFAALEALGGPYGGDTMEYEAGRLARIGPEAVPRLVAAMDSQQRRVPQLAMMTLGRLATEEAVDALIHRIDHEAAQALAEAYILGDPERRPWTWRERPETAASKERIGEMLVAALDEEDTRFGVTAIRAMGLTRDSTFVEPLIEALKSGRPGFDSAAAGALGVIGDPAAVIALMSTAMTGDHHRRVKALGALGRIGDPRAREVLVASLESEHAEVRSAACYALCGLWEVGPVPELVQVLEQDVARRKQGIPGQGVAHAAARALAATGGPHAIPALEKAVLEGEELYETRAEVAEYLGSFGEGGVDRLLPMLDSDDPGLVFAAACGLASAGDLRALAPLMAARTDGAGSEMKSGAIAELVAANPEGIAKALSPDNPDVEARRRAASAARLAFMPDGPVARPSSEVLIRALKRAAATDPDQTVRRSALSALRYLPSYSL
jgi:HEAT repeat protein